MICALGLAYSVNIRFDIQQKLIVKYSRNQFYLQNRKLWLIMNDTVCTKQRDRDTFLMVDNASRPLHNIKPSIWAFFRRLGVQSRCWSEPIRYSVWLRLRKCNFRHVIGKYIYLEWQTICYPRSLHYREPSIRNFSAVQCCRAGAGQSRYFSM